MVVAIATVMTHILLTAQRTELTPSECIAQHAEVFAVFDAATQDSGNVSYGVRNGNERLFVKTAGAPEHDRPLLSYEERVALLRNAIRLAGSMADPALPVLRNVVESPHGPLLVYEWVDGELLRRKAAPDSPFARFVKLPARERVGALDVVFRVHVALEARGWIASDFYDGCLIYDFAAQRMHVIDLDNYQAGANDTRMSIHTGAPGPE